jgi:hypothetical protein
MLQLKGNNGKNRIVEKAHHSRKKRHDNFNKNTKK